MEINNKSYQFVICGTDTDIGKTIISAFFVRGLNASYWKPIQSGLEEETDSEKVARLSKITKKKIIPEAYRFNKPVSPHWASEMDDNIVEITSLKIPIINEPLIVETAGGLMVPLTRNFLQIDQIKTWQLPVILVCKSSLGTINHTLLSIEALVKRNIRILGIVMNGEKHLDNPRTLNEFSGLPIIAEFPLLENLSTYNLDRLWRDLDIKNKLNSILKSKRFK